MYVSYYLEYERHAHDILGHAFTGNIPMGINAHDQTYSFSLVFSVISYLNLFLLLL